MASEFTYKFTEIASNDLDEIFKYMSIQLDNKTAAKDFFDKVTESINRICSFPELGKLVQNELLTRDDVRRVVIDNYILYYIPDMTNKEIYILSIAYGKRNLIKLMMEFNLM